MPTDVLERGHVDFGYRHAHASVGMAPRHTTWTFVILRKVKNLNLQEAERPFAPLRVTFPDRYWVACSSTLEHEFSALERSSNWRT